MDLQPFNIRPGDLWNTKREGFHFSILRFLTHSKPWTLYSENVGDFCYYCVLDVF